MKDKVFLDTNVVIDLLGEREAYYISAAKIATLADKGEIQLVASALTIATTYFVLSKYEKDDVVREKLKKFKIIASVSDLTDKVIEKSLVSKFSDFEDALQYHCALKEECSIIITRNGKDFIPSEIPILTPDEYLNLRKISRL